MASRLWALVFAIGPITDASSSPASPVIPLNIGVYVDAHLRCDSGHGYNYLKFDGRSLASGGDSYVEVLRPETRSSFIATRRDSMTGRLIHDRIAMISRSEFILSDGFGRYRDRYCPSPTLPKDFRDWSLSPNR